MAWVTSAGSGQVSEASQWGLTKKAAAKVDANLRCGAETPCSTEEMGFTRKRSQPMENLPRGTFSLVIGSTKLLEKALKNLEFWLS